MSDEKNIADIAVFFPHWPLDQTYSYKVPDNQIMEVGSVVSIPFGRRKALGVIINIRSSGDEKFKLKEIIKLQYPYPIFSQEKIELIKWMAKNYFYPLGQCFEAAIPAFIKKSKKDLLPNIEKILLKKEDHKDKQEKLTLNKEQQNVLAEISNLDPCTNLIWGITGSGKTEVYLQYVEALINDNKDVIILVPEISLTPQLKERFEQRFPGLVAVFHSDLKTSEKKTNWILCQQGKRKIALGPRSALFAPLKNIGAIIIDEEHDQSYQQDEKLKYHARESAIYYAKLLKIPVLMGSATPSFESLYHALITKEYKIQHLTQRATPSSNLPKIVIINLKKLSGNKNFTRDPVADQAPEFEIPTDNFFLNSNVVYKITETLQRQEQVLIFLNRRGQANQIVCKSCGHQFKCPNCEIFLTPHKHSLTCHYCEYKIKSFKKSDCPSCENSNIEEVGIGTEKVAELLSFYFPNEKIIRVDQDSTTKRDSIKEALDKFKNKESNILVGTQMLAKGHDFPDLTLVIVLWADIGLNIPNYKSIERGYQLLTQVAGRSGRSHKEGEVLIQTFMPELSIFNKIKDTESSFMDNYLEVFHEELSKRKLFHYPPTSTMGILRFDGLIENKVAIAAKCVMDNIFKIQQDKIKLLGPSPAAIFKLRNRYRYQIIIKAENKIQLDKIITWIFNGWKTNKLDQKYQTRLAIEKAN